MGGGAGLLLSRKGVSGAGRVEWEQGSRLGPASVFLIGWI